MENNAPRRHDICVVKSERGVELAKVGAVRNGFIRTYSLKKDGLFDKERDIHLRTETIYHIGDPEKQAMAELLWEKIGPDQIWPSLVKVKKSILTGKA
jgi:hypothetical protein